MQLPGYFRQFTAFPQGYHRMSDNPYFYSRLAQHTDQVMLELVIANKRSQMVRVFGGSQC